MTSLIVKLLNFISSDNFNLIVAEKGSYMNVPIISSVLNECAINQKKRIYMYCLENKKSYYMSRLISLVTGIDINTVHNYCNPCDCYDTLNKKTLKNNEYDDYLKGMEKIIESDLMMAGYTDSLEEHITYKDPLDTILLEYSDDELAKMVDIVIIDSLSLLVKHSKYEENEIFSRMKKYAEKYKTKFLIFDCWNHFVDSEDIDNIVTVMIDDASNKLILDNNNSKIEIEYDDKKRTVVLN